MTIIDTHAHIYPDAIALKAAKSTGTFYDIPMCLDGTLGQLMAHGEAAGISRFLVHSVAVTPSRVHSINDYLMRVSAEHPDRLIGFGTLHPDYEDVPGELDRIKAGGLHGVKLHPDIQTFLLDDRRAVAMFRAMAERGLPAPGPYGQITAYAYSQPERMAHVLDQVPDLKVICAHLGGWSVWKEAWRVLAGGPMCGWIPPPACTPLSRRRPRASSAATVRTARSLVPTTPCGTRRGDGALSASAADGRGAGADFPSELRGVPAGSGVRFSHPVRAGIHASYSRLS